jgi:protein phosphatase
MEQITSNTVLNIQCPNNNCKQSNPQTNKFCTSCSTPIIKRYLRILGDQGKSYQIGELLGDRYILVSEGIVLDTKPGIVPKSPTIVPSEIIPYLKLFVYRLHTPQIFGYIPLSEENYDEAIWLLEYGTVPTDEEGTLIYEDLLPEIKQFWKGASALRQLNWLWQTAQLWEPLASKEVVSSLLNFSLLRVNGPNLQLIDLEKDGDVIPSLEDLGQLWRTQLLPNCSPSIRDFFLQLCISLEGGFIKNSEQLTIVLDQALREYAQLPIKRTYQIYTCTDVGKVREHNEDACYPPPNRKVFSDKGGGETLAIVCDGLGGQEGGEIASNAAIEIIERKMNAPFVSEVPEAKGALANIRLIEEAISQANNIISKRNDSENRQARRRMGTTVVLSIAHDHEMYLGHIGDSRIYWITKTGCHQVTVDDDLASMEVRMGFAVHRDLAQYGTSGALTQALGMSSSEKLRTTVQRLVIDDDCVFLLCSDGLSDFDRVEQYWETEILPIVQGEIDVEKAGKHLLEIAREKNGHDNITFALVHCQVKEIPTEEKNSITWSAIQSALPTIAIASPDIQSDLPSFTPPLLPATAKLLAPPKPNLRSPAFIALIVIVLIAFGQIVYLLFSLLQTPTAPTNNQTPESLPSEFSTPEPLPANPEPSPSLGDQITPSPGASPSLGEPLPANPEPSPSPMP